ncbi:retrotransposon protein, putative, unclassified [Panicum miliaceum]|uniref:Retrotransposon protein, putative, unclassified n=1 Tax=Panicum miliaceum TaxID=4540 RepID=A0A3L6RI73_PANMI|nr:retrotransposon protein, putative, unclassified [Panicum miliaceum]
MTAHHQASLPTPPENSIHGAQGWDPSALYTALNTASVSTPPSASEWYLDTGASTHMSSASDTLSSPSPLPFSTFVTVGNGARLPVTHTASTTIPTSSSSDLHLRNILITPSLIKNLISVKQLTRDNTVSIEFDLAGFSIRIFQPEW